MLLHRDDPAKDPLIGNIKVTRQDWLNAALAVLKSGGVEAVKVAELAAQLQVSRSSFYWYFTNRQDLLDHLLAGWEARNTRTVVDRCAAPADTITQAVCNFFTCFVDPKLFDRGLDFAVREWARRDTSVRRLIDEADKTRLAAIIAMFERHGYVAEDADALGCTNEILSLRNILERGSSAHRQVACYEQAIAEVKS